MCKRGMRLGGIKTEEASGGGEVRRRGDALKGMVNY